MKHSKYSITSIKHPSFCNKCSPKLSVPITPPSSFMHIFITISYYSFTVTLNKRHKKHNIKLISVSYLTINFLIILLRKIIRKLKDAYNNAVNSFPFFGVLRQNTWCFRSFRYSFAINFGISVSLNYYCPSKVYFETGFQSSYSKKYRIRLRLELLLIDTYPQTLPGEMVVL